MAVLDGNIAALRRRRQTLALHVGLALGLAGLSGCAALPSAGPGAAALERSTLGAADGTDGFLAVPLSAAVSRQIAAAESAPPLQTSVEEAVPPRELAIGIGDRLTVNIWEPTADGAFSTGQTRMASLHAVVDSDGLIYVPYAGRIRAATLTVEQLRREVGRGLAGKAVDPQVQILLDENRANSVVLMGDVAKAGQVALPHQGLRLLDALALSGGARHEPYATTVVVSRRARSTSFRLSEVIADPRRNIWLATGDTLLIKHEPRSFAVFGAVAASGRYPFADEDVSLADALGQAGGLLDHRAAAGAVFLIRLESRRLAQTLSGMPAAKLASAVATDAVPVIYRLDLAKPMAFFIAQGVKMRDEDIIYVANHPAADLGKFLSGVALPLLGSARTTQVLMQ